MGSSSSEWVARNGLLAAGGIVLFVVEDHVNEILRLVEPMVANAPIFMSAAPSPSMTTTG